MSRLFSQDMIHFDKGVNPFFNRQFRHGSPLAFNDSRHLVEDGLGNQVALNEAYDEALVSYACWKLFMRIEQGLEGPKTDTLFYKGQYLEALDDLDSGLGKARPRPEPTVCEVNY